MSFINCKSNYIEVRWVFGDIWKKYFISHNSEISEKKASLKKNLDGISCSIIDTICERLFFLSAYEKYSNQILYQKSLIFSQNEIEEQLLIQKSFDHKCIKNQFQLPIEYYSISSFFFDAGLKFVPREKILHINETDFLDCGAFFGDSALSFLKYHPRKIYGFEPNYSNYILLQNTIELNALNDIIIPINMAIGKEEKIVELIGDNSEASIADNNFHRQFIKNEILSEKIQMTSIDNFIFKKNIKPGLIKMDIEGFEFDAIMGAIGTIKKYNPILLISIYHNPRDFFEIKPFLEMNCPNYKFCIRRLDPFHPTTETVLICYPE